MSFQTPRRAPLVVLFCFAAAVFQCGAALILDNLSNTSDGANNAGSFGVFGGEPGFDATRGAAGFTLASTESGVWTFTIRVNNSLNSPVNLTLVNSVSGLPGSTVQFSLSSATFVSSLPGGGTGYQFTSTGEQTLSAGTYWLIASTGTSPLETFDWVERRTQVASTPLPYTGSATFAGFANDSGGGWGSQGNFYPGLQIDVTPVPELAHTGIAAALFLVGCSAAPLVRRSRFMARWRARRNPSP